jgi:Tfp pilus assembly protein PilO
MQANRKQSKGVQGFVDAVYLESVRRGLLVMVILATALSAGLGYLLYSYVLYSWIESNRAYKQQVVAKEVENKKTEAMLSTEPQFRAQFNKVAELFEEAKPLLPEETEVSDVLGQIEAAAQRNGVKLTGLQAVRQSIKSPTAAKLYEREIPAVVTGSYPQVVRFLSDISRMPRILLVRDYSIASLKSSVSAGFTLVAYHAPPPAEMPPLPKDIAMNSEVNVQQ